MSRMLMTGKHLQKKKIVLRVSNPRPPDKGKGLLDRQTHRVHYEHFVLC